MGAKTRLRLSAPRKSRRKRAKLLRNIYLQKKRKADSAALEKLNQGVPTPIPSKPFATSDDERLSSRIDFNIDDTKEAIVHNTSEYVDKRNTESINGRRFSGNFRQGRSKGISVRRRAIANLKKKRASVSRSSKQENVKLVVYTLPESDEIDLVIEPRDNTNQNGFTIANNNTTSQVFLEDFQSSTDGGTSCTATDPLSFGIPATKKRKNVIMDTEDPDVQQKCGAFSETSIKTEATEYREDEECPKEDLNQYVVKTEPIDFVEEELPIDEKLNPTQLRQYMEQQKNPLEDIEQNQYFQSKNNDTNQYMNGSMLYIKQEPIRSDINETRHFQNSASQTTFAWEDIKALQDENKRLKIENETLRQLKQR